MFEHAAVILLHESKPAHTSFHLDFIIVIYIIETVVLQEAPVYRVAGGDSYQQDKIDKSLFKNSHTSLPFSVLNCLLILRPLRALL